MAADEDMMEGSVPSAILDSPQQSENEPSVEDLAWADSCLIKEHEVSDEGWSSLKDALLEILSSEPESVYSTAATTNDGSLGQIDIEVLPSIEEADDLAHTNEVKSATDDAPTDGPFKTRIFAGNVFLPNYVEEQEDENVGSRRDSGISADVSDQSSEQIFRVWDLDIPVEEEDELAKQLNKALTDDSFESIPSTRADSEAWEDLDSESIDDLIAGIADLSLDSFSS